MIPTDQLSGASPTSAVAPTPAVAPSPTLSTRLRSWLMQDQFGVALALGVLVAVMAVLAPNFLSVDNLLDVARQISAVAILAAGGTFVILTRGIDLSVGSALGVCAMVSVGLATKGVDPTVCIVAALAAGALIGAVNGVLTARFGLAAFIVTLAALTYLRGLVYVGTGGTTLFSETLGFASIGQGTVAGIPVAVVIMAVVFGLGWYTLNRTVFGRHVLAVGGNEEAARLSGVPVRRVVFTVYLISGVCAAIAGLILAARLQGAVPDLGTGYELNAIAAVVLGGTSLMGGRGSLVGTLIGAAILGVLVNGLTLLNVASFYQLIIQGGVILLAVFVDHLRGVRSA
jgi:ribose transport system permease protein